MSVITNAIQFIIDLGPTVMMPILITLIGVCIRVPFLRALKGGLLVGIGFIGLNATVTTSSSPRSTTWSSCLD